ncbi:unnamed protein product, partial [Polarella glacialis]
YFMSSFMSHSCFPNAVWHYDGDDFVLRARRDIEVHDEITVSYLSEDCLLESSASRRRHLKDSKHFVCNCERCFADRDPCRGLRCPKCKAVSLMFGLPTGYEAEPVAGSRCEHCGSTLEAGEAATLQAEEKLLESALEKTTS